LAQSSSRCRPWRLHGRNLDKLNADNCSDLIETFKSAGRQRIPAAFRRLWDDSDHEFEIIAGVRRWWTVQWLREHHHAESVISSRSVDDG
jgi:ParB family chromosome partitioning protein